MKQGPDHSDNQPRSLRYDAGRAVLVGAGTAIGVVLMGGDLKSVALAGGLAAATYLLLGAAGHWWSGRKASEVKD